MRLSLFRSLAAAAIALCATNAARAQEQQCPAIGYSPGLNVPGTVLFEDLWPSNGDLDFNAAGSAGHREINVGMGHMQLLLDKDKSYSKLEVNVGLGTLHDHRPGGSDGHFTVTKEYPGTGAGSLQINVGMGSLDIRND